MLEKLLRWGSRRRSLEPAGAIGRGNSTTIASHPIVDGRAVVTVHEHSFTTVEGQVSCWTFVSDGLARVGQKDVVLAIRREAESRVDDTRHALDIFESLHALACQGRIVDVGSFSGLAPDSPGWCGDAEWRGIAYLPTNRLTDIMLPSPAIAALVLTQNELDVAMELGLVRVMALLGFRYRYFPTAAWFMRGRPEITSPTEMSASLISRMPRVRVAMAHAYLRGIETRREARPPTGSLENSAAYFARQEVVLELPGASALEFGRLLGQLGPGSPIALIASPDPGADACLVWMPGMSEPNAIAAPEGTGLRIAGNHVVFVPEQDHDEVRVFEDGFAILVTNTTWQEMRLLFANGPQNWGMPVDGDKGFRLKVLA